MKDKIDKHICKKCGRSDQCIQPEELYCTIRDSRSKQVETIIELYHEECVINYHLKGVIKTDITPYTEEVLALLDGYSSPEEVNEILTVDLMDRLHEAKRLGWKSPEEVTERENERYGIGYAHGLFKGAACINTPKSQPSGDCPDCGGSGKVKEKIPMCGIVKDGLRAHKCKYLFYIIDPTCDKYEDKKLKTIRAGITCDSSCEEALDLELSEYEDCPTCSSTGKEGCGNE